MLLREQIFAFLVMILTGIVSGFCYDFYLVLKSRWKLKKTGTGVGDLLFWAALTVLVFSLLLVGNYGELRLYVVIALGLGLLIYFKIISKGMVSLLQMLFNTIQKLWLLTIKTIAFFWKIVLFPLRIIKAAVCYPVNLLNKIISMISSWLKGTIRKILSRPVKALKFRMKNIYSSIKRGKPK